MKKPRNLQMKIPLHLKLNLNQLFNTNNIFQIKLKVPHRSNTFALIIKLLKIPLINLFNIFQQEADNTEFFD